MKLLEASLSPREEMLIIAASLGARCSAHIWWVWLRSSSFDTVSIDDASYELARAAWSAALDAMGWRER